MDIAIRPATADDHDRLTQLSMRSKQSNGYDDAFMQACRDELTVSRADVLAGDWWVAESAAPRVGGERPLRGCACLLAGADNTAELHAFFIDPDFQRRGVGRLLWGKILKRAIAMRVKRIVLDSDPNAVPFYLALGFHVIGEKPSGSIAGRMLPHMAISL